MNTKRIFIVTVALTAIFVLSISAVAAQNGTGNGNNGTGGGQGNGYQGGQNSDAPRGNAGDMNGNGLLRNLPPTSVDELPENVIELMIDGWTDEVHAYTVYGAVIDQFGAVRPFTNIQRSELQHIAAWETLFDRYGIIVPEVPTFDPLVFTSVGEACSVGVTAEIANFALYDSMLTAFEPYPDLLYVTEALRSASEFNHLPAFENCAS